MEIILTGEYNYLMKAFLDKFSKEGHNTYVISGAHYDRDKFPKVYEQYDFSYESISMRQIFESINPDVLIFMGAYDTSFNWAREQAESVKYNAGLVNMLMAASSLKKKTRIIYLSSDEIYSDPSENDLTEDISATARDVKGLAVAQGELTVDDYRRTLNLNAVTVRLSHLYGIPVSHIDLPQPIGAMTREAIEDKQISGNSNYQFSMLHVSDAVDAVYRLMTAENSQIKHEVYNISSDCVITEAQAADYTASAFKKSDNIRENIHSLPNPYRLVLSNERFKEDFGMEEFHKPSEEVPKIVSFLKKNPKKFLFDEDEDVSALDRFRTRFGAIIKALLPFVENFIVFIPFFMLNNRATGSEYFSNIDFLLLYVIFFALIYGQQQATFSALLATAGFLFRTSYGRTGFEVLLDYNTYVWIAQLFIIGLLVGHLKDRLTQMTEEKKDEIDYMRTQVDDITDINTTNVAMKGIMENQVINQDDSFGKIYAITSSLDRYEPEEVLFYAAEVLEKLIHTKDIAIYMVANEDYARLFASTSDKARSLGNSIRYSDMTAMYTELNANRVYINKDMDQSMPLMADGISANDKLKLIIMVWGLPWERMNLGQANMLKVTGYLIQNSVLRAERYLDAVTSTRYEQGTDILESDAFTRLLKGFISAQKRNLAVCSVLKIGGYLLNGDKEAAREVADALRNTDYLGRMNDNGLYVLLTNTSEENAVSVIERIRRKDLTAELVKELPE